MGQIEENKLQFPILVQFLDQSQKTNLTHSTEKTYSLLKQGYSVTDIMSIRRLKKSTIEDHLVELALHNKEFSIDPYVSMEKQQQIQRAAKKLNSKQLKQIYHEVKNADYFEIRLVLAKYGDDIMKLENYLNQYFHFNTFRPGQKEVITSILDGLPYNGHVAYWYR